MALQVFIDNWRWAGVPFFLRTGKRLPKRASEISVQLKPVPAILFNKDPAARLDPNVLTVRIQPDEGFALGISSKVPGPRVRDLSRQHGLRLRQHLRRQLSGSI